LWSEEDQRILETDSSEVNHVTKVRTIALPACFLLILPVALAIRAFQNKPLPASPPPQPTVAVRAAIILDKAPPAPTPELAPVKSLVPLTKSIDVLEMVAAPAKNELLIITESGKDRWGEPDAYGGVLYHIRFDGAKPEAQEIVSGSNVVSRSAPVWNPDGTVAYYTYDNGTCAPMGTGSCGIFMLEPETGKMEQLLADSTAGLAISRDGSTLAFWDGTAGDKLTVLDLRTKTIVKGWAGEVHSADDSVLSDIAFAPDGKSVFALTYAGREIPLKQFNLETGKVRTVSHYAQSLVAAADAVYFLQFQPPSVNPEHRRTLMKIVSSDSEPEKVLENFPYHALWTSGSRRWLVTPGGERGIAIYDTRDQTIRVAGKDCQSAAVMADGELVYAVRGELTLDSAACGAPKSAQP
jgi:hypothetical protein